MHQKDQTLKVLHTLQDKGIKLYALVNNAGVLWAEADTILNTNFKGPKRVTDAFGISW